MVYIIAHADEKAAIMRAIHENAGPGTKAGAICSPSPSPPSQGFANAKKTRADVLHKGSPFRGRFPLSGESTWENL
ncbi:MAG: hypothetical protein ACLU3I_00390 [Acutalibacteraceae bacterium]